MKTKVSLIVVGLLGIVLFLANFQEKKPGQSIAMAYAKLPLSFIENQGQVDQKAKFYLKGSDHSIFFTNDEIVYAFADSLIRQKFVGANQKTMIRGSKQAQGKVNYLTGQDQRNWKTNIPTYEEVIYKDLYPGIDLVLKGESQGKLKSEFQVAAGADYKKIVIAYNGIDELKVSDAGDLVIQSAKGELQEKRPYIYQVIDGKKMEVLGGYRLLKNQYRFELVSYDPNHTLIIDPELIFSTFLGGSDLEVGYGIAIDSGGNVYVTGRADSQNFPTTASAFQTTDGNGYDAFVTKLSADGSSLIYSTYLGGNLADEGIDIAVDSSGNAYITGWTYSINFPTASSLQATKGGIKDVFVTKLSMDGSSLIYSTFLGGNSFDESNDIAVDSSGNAYVTGMTGSQNFPTTASAFQTTDGNGYDAFVTKFSPDGSSLIYSTFLGGDDLDDGVGIAVDSSGNAYVTGITRSANFPTASAFQATIGGGGVDAFVTKLSPGGSSLVYSTYLGGNLSDEGIDIAVDSSGSAYVTGRTVSQNFPMASAFQTTKGANYEIFVTKFSPDGSSLNYSTYLGGNDLDEGFGIAVDSSGYAYVTGRTYSSNFPTASAFQATKSGDYEAILAKFSPNGSSLVYSTYLGGSSLEISYAIAVDSSGNAYVTGMTGSQNFPTVFAFQANYAGSSDAFIAKIGEPQPPPIPDLSVSVSAEPIPAQSCQAVNFGFTVTNNGSAEAGNVTLTNAMVKSPMNLSLSSLSIQASQGGGCIGMPLMNPNNWTCQLGSISAGSSAQVTISATPSAQGNINNTAQVTTSSAESNTDNNNATLATPINALPSTDLKLKITALKSQSILIKKFNFKASNLGPNTAQGVVLTGTVNPASNIGASAMSLTVKTPNQGSCTKSGLTFSCSFGAINAGNNGQVAVELGGPVSSQTTIVGAVKSCSPDTNQANNNASIYANPAPPSVQ